MTGKCRKNARKRDKERQTTFKVSSAVEAGIAQAINDLSNPLGLTLNQRAVGSTPTRPTKFFNYLQSAAQPVIPPTVLNLC